MWCARGRLRTAAFQNLDKASGMASNTKLFGYWISSVDEEGAREAIKMAGLPVLVMGGNAALTALISLSQQTPDLTLASWCAIISLLLIIVAFRIRAGKAGWLPLVLALFAAFLVINVLTAYIAFMAVGAAGISSVQIVPS